jgi:NADH-quinone oxidoreductase subunit N
MNPATFVGPSIDWFLVAPLLALVAGIVVLLAVGSLTPHWPKGWYAGTAALAAGAAGTLAVTAWDRAAQPVGLVAGSLVVDRFAIVAVAAIALSTVLVAVLSDAAGTDSLEFSALLLAAAVGGTVMVAANDLVVLFVGLETMSLAFYVLAASDRDRPTSGEAGLKYFILGGFASAFFLFGVALLYGSTGSTNLGTIAQRLASEVPVESTGALVLAGTALLFVGFAFKVSLVPFHVWTPDVYQGAPTPATAMFASVGKVVGVAALLRTFLSALPVRSDDWRPVVWVLAAATVVVGAVLAVVQRDAKRMLAYSSVSHAGFILVGLVAASRTNEPDAVLGVPAVAAYLVVYSVLVVGTLAAVAHAAGAGDAPLSSLDGLGRTSPVVAWSATVLLLAQAGVPLTAGFMAKFGVIRAAVATGDHALAVVAMLGAVVAAYLYLRLMVGMWLKDPAQPDRRPVSVSTGTVVVACAAATLAVGVVPGPLLDALAGLGL